MDESSHRAFELACAERLTNYYQELPAGRELLAMQGFRFVQTNLAGEYPDTRLVVVLDNLDTGEREAHGYPLWGDFFTNEDPHGVVNLLTTWLEEPLKPDDPYRGEIEIISSGSGSDEEGSQ